MKKLLVITILVLIGALAGWITFARTPGKAIFTIETRKMKDDAEKVIEKGKDLIEKKHDEKQHDAETTTAQEPGPAT
jgi:hypothetical protein